MRIFINSLPKSGTNLVAKLVESLGYQYSKKSIALSSQIGRYETIKRLTRTACWRGSNIAVGLEINASVSSAWVERYLRHVPEGHYVTGHSAYSDHLQDILCKNGYKTIQVIRNPYDVILSYAKYFVEKDNNYYPTYKTLKNLSLDDRVRLIAEGGKLIGCQHYMRSIREVLRLQEGWFESPLVLPVKFEDLVGPKGGGSRKKQEETIKDICLYLGIDTKRAEEIADSIYGGTHTFRSGKIGAARKYLDAELRGLIKENISGSVVLEKLGYINEG